MSSAASAHAAAAVAGAAVGGAGGAGGGADAVVRQRAVIAGLAALNQRLLDESAKQQLQVWKHRLTSALFDAKVLLALPGAVGGGAGGGGGAGNGDGGDGGGVGPSEEDVFGLFASLGQAAAEYDAFAARAGDRLQKGQDHDQAAPAAGAGGGDGDGGGGGGDTADDTEVSAFFANVKALVGQVAAAKATAEALVLAAPTKPVTAPVLLAVGLHENANLMALIGMAKPAHVALVTLRTAAQAYDYIHLTRVPGADFRPHAFRIITTAELHVSLRVGARALTLTPTLDCAYFDPDGATPDGTDGKLDGFEALTARLQFQ